MRSAGSGRRLLEGTLRAIVLGLLAWRLALAIRGPRHDTVEVAASSELRAALVRWSTVASPARVHASLDTPPGGLERDWLAALPGAGTRSSWSGPTLSPTAITVLAVADPATGADVLVATPHGAGLTVGDAASRVDTIRPEGRPSKAGPLDAASEITRLHLPRPGALVETAVGSVRARGALRDSLARRRLLVLGAAGWETKFVIAALEERGWTVDAHVAVAPGGDVAQGALIGLGRGPVRRVPVAAPGVTAAPIPGMLPGIGRSSAPPPVPGGQPAAPPAALPRLPRLTSIDTARYSAVVAVDSTAARASATILRFVRDGGGLVLLAAAAEAPGLRSLAPGKPGPPVGEESRASVGGVWRDSLPFRPLVSLKPDAVPLERRAGRVVTAARREGVGRVAETGALELWRWRMAGADAAAEEHRAWLARLVAGVAYAPAQPQATAVLDPAPVATLVDRLGPPRATAPRPVTPNADPLRAWSFAVLCLALLAEWLSRRLRSRP